MDSDVPIAPDPKHDKVQSDEGGGGGRATASAKWDLDCVVRKSGAGRVRRADLPARAKVFGARCYHREKSDEVRSGYAAQQLRDRSWEHRGPRRRGS